MTIATIIDNFLGILGCSISCSGYEGQLTAGKLYLNREAPHGGIHMHSNMYGFFTAECSVFTHEIWVEIKQPQPPNWQYILVL